MTETQRADYEAPVTRTPEPTEPPAAPSLPSPVTSALSDRRGASGPRGFFAVELRLEAGGQLSRDMRRIHAEAMDKVTDYITRQFLAALGGN